MSDMDYNKDSDDSSEESQEDEGVSVGEITSGVTLNSLSIATTTIPANSSVSQKTVKLQVPSGRNYEKKQVNTQNSSQRKIEVENTDRELARIAESSLEDAILDEDSIDTGGLLVDEEEWEWGVWSGRKRRSRKLYHARKSTPIRRGLSKAKSKLNRSVSSSALTRQDLDVVPKAGKEEEQIQKAINLLISGLATKFEVTGLFHGKDIPLSIAHLIDERFNDSSAIADFDELEKSLEYIKNATDKQLAAISQEEKISSIFGILATSYNLDNRNQLVSTLESSLITYDKDFLYPSVDRLSDSLSFEPGLLAVESDKRLAFSDAEQIYHGMVGKIFEVCCPYSDPKDFSLEGDSSYSWSQSVNEEFFQSSNFSDSGTSVWRDFMKIALAERVRAQQRRVGKSDSKEEKEKKEIEKAVKIRMERLKKRGGAVFSSKKRLKEVEEVYRLMEMRGIRRRAGARTAYVRDAEDIADLITKSTFSKRIDRLSKITR